MITKEAFILNSDNWDNYKEALWLAIEAAQGDIIELGMGKGSTELLSQYCRERSRKLYSYEFDFVWFKKYRNLQNEFHELHWMENWDELNDLHKSCGVLFVDNSPGESRKEQIRLWADKAMIICAHDTEPGSDHGYQMRGELAKFKYMKDFESKGAWTTLASNFIDVCKLS